MLTTIKFAKCKDNAIIPSKRDEDAGFDIYACFDDDYIAIKPHETKLIPTGICSAFDKDYVFILKERGSTGVRGISLRSGIIDSAYRGEIFVTITNTNEKPLLISDNQDVIKHYDRENITNCVVYPKSKAICQGLLIPIPEVEVEEYTYDELQNIPSNRGNGCLGSSGK